MNKKLDRNYYAALAVARDADDKTIKKAYRQAVLVCHPDKGGTDEEFQAVNEAWNVLSDSTKRAMYDNDLVRYKLQDGLGPIVPRKQRANRPQSGVRAAAAQQPAQPTTAERQQQAKQSGPVEIPPNLSSVPIKELKNILDALGMKRDDCFEKADLIARIEEYKEQKAAKKSYREPHPAEQHQRCRCRRVSISAIGDP